MAKFHWRSAGLWAMQLLFAFMYVNVGRTKLTQREGWVAAFRHWGFPDHFYLVIGALELLGGLALLHPRTAGHGFATLSVIMGGACLTHLVHDEMQRVGFTAGLFVVLGLLAWARRPEWFRARLAARPTA